MRPEVFVAANWRNLKSNPLPGQNRSIHHTAGHLFISLVFTKPSVASWRWGRGQSRKRRGTFTSWGSCLPKKILCHGCVFQIYGFDKNTLCGFYCTFLTNEYEYANFFRSLLHKQKPCQRCHSHTQLRAHGCTLLAGWTVRKICSC